MPFPFYIARRYLFAKKSHHAINVISAVSVLGVAVATMALVCTLSVFNGFHSLVASLFTALDPELKVVPAEGKTFDEAEAGLDRIKKLPCVGAVSATLEDKALAMYGGQQAMITLKGVDDNFANATNVGDILYGQGMFKMHADVLEYGVPGMRLAMTLGMDAHFIDPLKIYTPAKGARVNMAAPDESFNMDELNSAGVVFSVGQKKYDQSYVFCSLGFAQRMFDKDGQVSALEIKVADGYTVDEAKEMVQATVGDRFKTIDRYEQQEDIFRIMKVEKYMAYIFLVFILFIACFNIVGSLSMLIIDKKNDVRTLRSLGATDRQIRSIFLLEGRLISLAGTLLGIVAGLVLCLVQQQFGVLKLGNKVGAFVVDAYPVLVDPVDVTVVLVTVTCVAFLVSWYPVHYISKRVVK